MLRLFFYILGFIVPWSFRRVYLNSVFGFRIASGARIGFSLVLPKMLEMKDGARIGHMTVIKGLDFLSMDSYARLGNLNWVSGFPSNSSMHFSHIINRRPSLYIREHAAITNRHLIDCTDRIEIGPFSTIAGYRSQILTHSIDLVTSRQGCKPVSIGAYCFVGSASVVLGGAKLPDYAVLGAGALLGSQFDESYALYGGVPAKKIGGLPESYKYFSRQVGFVD